MRQLITPNPIIPCDPGWCLKYVHEAYGLKTAGYPTAIEAYGHVKFLHKDRNFPELWVPIWFTISTDPRGHVALLAPNNSVYSCSSATLHTPIHYASIDAMITDYAKVDEALGYLGWSEDIDDVKVIGETMIDRGRAIRLLRLTRRGVDEKKITALIGKNEDEWLDSVYRSDWFKEQTAKINAPDTPGTVLAPGTYIVKVTN